MPTDRIRMLEKFHEEDPADPFNTYALALEYLKHDPKRSRALFEVLLRYHEDYLPAYYHAAKFYQDMGEREEAVRVFEKGIALARKVDDRKALRELKSAYDELMFE